MTLYIQCHVDIQISALATYSIHFSSQLLSLAGQVPCRHQIQLVLQDLLLELGQLEGEVGENLLGPVQICFGIVQYWCSLFKERRHIILHLVLARSPPLPYLQGKKAL